MDIDIRYEGNITSQDSSSLQKLAELIENDCNLPVDIKKKPAEPGTKDGGLAIGIAIAGLGVALLGNLFNVLQYWKSRNPKYSISVKRNGITETKENLDFEQYQAEFAKLKQNDKLQIEVKKI